MSLKRTIRYSIFLISFITSVSFLNLNLAFNSIDRSPVDAGLRLGLHETFRRRHERQMRRQMCVRCALCPVTTGNCHHFCNKTSSTEILYFNNFGYNLSLYGEMAAITYTEIEQNYSKYIFNDSISQNLQPIRGNESKVKYYWIIYPCYFYRNNSTSKGQSPFCYYFFDTVYHSIPFTQCCLLQ